MPTGTLMKKIQGHERSCVSAPPTIRPIARAADRDRRPDAERLRALRALLERRRDDRERGRRDERGAETLERAAADQHPRGLREAVEQRRDREDDEAEEEEPLAPEQVARAAAEQQEAAEDERVRVDDPLEVGLREPEVLLDRRQRDVHDRRVEHDHELREADEDEDDPAVRRPAPLHDHGLPCHAPRVAETARAAAVASSLSSTR